MCQIFIWPNPEGLVGVQVNGQVPGVLCLPWRNRPRLWPGISLISQPARCLVILAGPLRELTIPKGHSFGDVQQFLSSKKGITMAIAQLPKGKWMLSHLAGFPGSHLLSLGNANDTVCLTQRPNLSHVTGLVTLQFIFLCFIFERERELGRGKERETEPDFF